jgi:O-antigen/teichoic acid export membrane protein
MRALFRRYRRQVTIDIPSTFIAALGLNLMTFFLMTLFNQRTLGFYALANRIAITPLQLFNDALGQVFFQKAARSQEATGRFWNEMKFNVLTSGILSLGVLGGIWLLARPFIGLYLGKGWLPAADMLLILAPMLAMRSLCMSVATTVFVLRRPQWLLYHNIANAVAQAIAFAIGWASGMGVTAFLALAAGLLFVEYFVFAALLIVAAYRGARPTVAGKG